MPIAVEDAYKGLLTRDELISLIQKICVIKKYNIPLPCDIDYDKMMKGFQERKKRIFSGEVIEPKRRTFSEKSQLEKDSFDLYDAIEKFDDELILYENKVNFLAMLTGQSKKQRYDMKGMVIGAFDERVLNLFLAKYYSVDNYQKRELALTFMGLGFTDTIYMSKDHRKETVENLNKLKQRISKNDTTINDCISKAIGNNFIENIEALIAKIKEIIKEYDN